MPDAVVLHPVDSLTFHLLPGASPQAVLTIRNPSGPRMVAFKVQTTDPSHFFFNFSQGLLRPNTTKSVVITLQQQHSDVLRVSPAARKLSIVGFKVESRYVDDDCFEHMKISNEDVADFEYVWATADQPSLVNKNLSCQFRLDAGGEINAAVLATYGEAEIRLATARVWAHLSQIIQSFPADDVSESLSDRFNAALHSNGDLEEKASAPPAPQNASRRRASSAGDCIVCYDRPRIAVCVPCGHNAVCMECADEILKTTSECPMCRKPIEQAIKLFKV